MMMYASINSAFSLLVICNDIHDAGLLAVAKMLQVNNILSQLHIWGNHWTTPTCDVSQFFVCKQVRLYYAGI